MSGCDSQLALIRYLGLDVFSRNIYSDPETGWWGGFTEIDWAPEVTCQTRNLRDGRDRVIERAYITRAGVLTERLRYAFSGSTLVQEKYPVEDYETQLDALEEILRARRWRFIPERYHEWRARAGEDGVVVAGELHCPLKMLHVLLNPTNTTFLLNDQPDRAARLLAIHEEAMLDLVRQMCDARVQVMMSMDNLDTAFHPTRYVERYSASYYEKAAELCHRHGSLFFIHACVHQRRNLKLIDSLGVDGLEDVAFPPLGDVELDEALAMTGERLIVTGGISAMEFDKLAARDDVFGYIRSLMDRVRSCANRFILSASCNTPYDASWEKLLHFRDAWLEYRDY
jgi:uroporphyrinogen-III decarboxylase